MSESAIAKAKTEATVAKESSHVLAQDVFQDMVQAAKLGHSDTSRPALDAQNIVGLMKGDSNKESSVFTELASDVKNSKMMSQYGLSGKVEKDAHGQIESLVFSSIGAKSGSDKTGMTLLNPTNDASSTKQLKDVSTQSSSEGTTAADSAKSLSTAADQQAAARHAGNDTRSADDQEASVEYYNNHLSAGGDSDQREQPRMFTTSNGQMGENYQSEGEIVMPGGQVASYTPNSDGSATSFTTPSGQVGVAYPDGQVEFVTPDPNQQ